jgi:hypothetical protein
MQFLYAEKAAAKKLTREDLRSVIRPAYRNLFELLSGTEAKTKGSSPPLGDTQLLVHDGKENYRFEPGKQMYYAGRSGIREIFGIREPVWTFVHEALPIAKRPLTSLFGAKVLEDSMVWSPDPGEHALEDQDEECFRSALRDLAPYLLARLRTERNDDRLVAEDTRGLRQLIDEVEPVSDLRVSCTLDGVPVSIDTNRSSFVERTSRGVRAFVRWGENPWPPTPDEAEALAVAVTDLLQVGYLESFLSLLQTDRAGRERLLHLAGASDFLEQAVLDLTDSEILDEQREEDEGSIEDENGLKTRPESADDAPEKTATPPWEQPTGAARLVRTPLISIEDLSFDGLPVQVTGLPPRRMKTVDSNDDVETSSDRAAYSKSGYGGTTDLSELDRLGMYVAMTYECVRLRREGIEDAQIFEPSIEVNDSTLIFNVATLGAVDNAAKASARFKEAMERLRELGVSPAFPGFDVFTLDPQDENGIGRLIELKSSGVNARTQSMSWNEWKTAMHGKLCKLFYLYLVGNLRADIPSAIPFIRTIHDPFMSLGSEESETTQVRRSIQLNILEFEAAEHLNLK